MSNILDTIESGISNAIHPLLQDAQSAYNSVTQFNPEELIGTIGKYIGNQSVITNPTPFQVPLPSINQTAQVIAPQSAISAFTSGQPQQIIPNLRNTQNQAVANLNNPQTAPFSVFGSVDNPIEQVGQKVASLVNEAKTTKEFADLLSHAEPEVQTYINNVVKDVKNPITSLEDFFTKAKEEFSPLQDATHTVKPLTSKLPLATVNRNIAQTLGQRLQIDPQILYQRAMSEGVSLQPILDRFESENPQPFINNQIKSIQSTKVIQKSDQITKIPPPLQHPTTLSEVSGRTKGKIVPQASIAQATPHTVAPQTVTQSQEYVTQLVKAQEDAAKIEKGSIAQRGQSLLADLKRKLVDSTAPIEDVLGKAQREGNYQLRPQFNIASRIDAAIRARELAGQFIKDQGMAHVIQRAPSLETLNQYLIAKHAPEVETAGFATGRNVSKDAQLVKDFAPVYEPYAQKVVQYGQQLLHYIEDAGLISKQTAQALREKYPEYVPLNRIIAIVDKATESEGAHRQGIASQSYQTVVKRLKGSDLAIKNPLESLLTKTVDAFNQGERNKSAQLLASYKDLPDNPFGIKRLQPDMIPIAKVQHTGQIFPEVMNAVEHVVKQYGGSIERKLKTGRAFGHYQPALNKITTKFGTSKDTLLHEFGHLLDTKFGLNKSDFFNRETNVELRKIADLRQGNRAYTRSAPEKIGEFISTYFADLANAKKVAPITTAKFTKFLADKPELKGIVSAMKSRVRSQEQIEETIFRPSAFEPKTPHFTVLEDGQKKYYETTPEIAQAAKLLDKRQLGFIGQLFAAPVRLARIGITGINLPFIAGNLAKDQITAFINSDHALQTSLANPSVFLQSAWAAIGHGAEYENWVRNAGGGTSFDISRGAPETSIAQLRAERSLPSKIQYTVTHPSQLLRTVENIVNRGEEQTRLQQFIGTRNSLLKQGKTLQDANLLAAQASRENTVNFARSGDWGKALNSVFLYMNAGIQGSRTLLRNLQTKPVQTATKLALTVFTPLAAVTAWNLADPKRKAAYDDIRTYEKDNNLVFVPPNPTKDADGKWNVIKIPFSQEIANLTVPLREGIEALHGADPPGFMDFAKAILGTTTSLNVSNPQQLVGQFLPQAVKPGLEATLNKNTFSGTDIVPQFINGKASKDLPADQQAYPDTSGTARLIAKPLGVSPLKVAQFVNSTFGGVGSQALNTSDQALATTGLIPKEQIGGQSIPQGLQSRFAQAAGGQKLTDLYNTKTTQPAMSGNKLYYKDSLGNVQTLDLTLPTLPQLTGNKQLDTKITAQSLSQINSLERGIIIANQAGALPSAQAVSYLKHLEQQKVGLGAEKTDIPTLQQTVLQSVKNSALTSQINQVAKDYAAGNVSASKAAGELQALQAQQVQAKATKLKTTKVKKLKVAKPKKIKVPKLKKIKIPKAPKIKALKVKKIKVTP
jgi:hypothetical protein